MAGGRASRCQTLRAAPHYIAPLCRATTPMPRQIDANQRKRSERGVRVENRGWVAQSVSAELPLHAVCPVRDTFKRDSCRKGIVILLTKWW